MTFIFQKGLQADKLSIENVIFGQKILEIEQALKCYTSIPPQDLHYFLQFVVIFTKSGYHSNDIIIVCIDYVTMQFTSYFRATL